MEFELPVSEAAAVSVAVIICLPAVVTVAGKALLPDANVESGGSCA